MNVLKRFAALALAAIAAIAPVAFADEISRVSPPVIGDFDHDGLVDYVYACDYDGDNDTDEDDITAALAAIADEPWHVELCAATFLMDRDGDGQGETGLCANSGNSPMVCITRSNGTFSGQGPGATILKMIEDAECVGAGDPVECCTGAGTGACDAGTQEFVRVNTGTVHARSAAVLSNVTIRDMSVDGRGCISATENGKGFRLMDTDDSTMENVACRDLAQSCFDLTRARDNNRVINGRATNVGNYGTCVAKTPQPCLYIYTDDGAVSTNTQITNVRCDGVGGPMVNFRADYGVSFSTGQTKPYPDTPLAMDANAAQVAQSFQTVGDTVYTGITTSLMRTSSATGVVRVRIETNNAGEPSGTAVTDYDDCDNDVTPPCYKTIDVADLPVGNFDLALFRMDLSAGFPAARLSDVGTPDYWVVFEAAVADGEVFIAHDGTGTADSYTDGVALMYDGATWSATGDASSDLGGELLSGFHDQPILTNVVLSNSDAADPIAVQLQASYAPTIVGLTSDSAGVISLGADSYVGFANLTGVTSTWDKSRADPSTGGIGIVIGQHAPHATITAGTVIGTPGVVPCLRVNDFAHDVEIRGLKLSGCGGPGIRVNDGVKRLLIADNEISGPQGDGIYLNQGFSAPVDGVDETLSDIRIVGNTITRTLNSGITKSANGSKYRSLTIRDNSFTYTGDHGVNLNHSTNTTDHLDVSLIGNTYHGWCMEAACAADSAAVQLQGDFQNLIVRDETYVSTGNNEARYVYADGADGFDNWLFDNLRGRDEGSSVATDYPYRFINNSGKNMVGRNITPVGTGSIITLESWTKFDDTDRSLYVGDGTIPPSLLSSFIVNTSLAVSVAEFTNRGVASGAGTVTYFKCITDAGTATLNVEIDNVDVKTTDCVCGSTLTTCAINAGSYAAGNLFDVDISASSGSATVAVFVK